MSNTTVARRTPVCGLPVSYSFASDAIFDSHALTDGDLLRPLLIAWGRARGMLEPDDDSSLLYPYVDQHELLFAAYEELVAPQVQPHVHVEFVSTSHNPVRAMGPTPDGTMDFVMDPEIRESGAHAIDRAGLSLAAAGVFPTLTPQTVIVPTDAIVDLADRLYRPLARDVLVVADRIWWDDRIVPYRHRPKMLIPDMNRSRRRRTMHLARRVAHLEGVARETFFTLATSMSATAAVDAARLVESR